jgi:Uma2 family endonuclease
MIAIAAKPSFSFEEYLKYNDGTDNRYEFFDGELILMNPPNGRHALIIRNLCNLLENEFFRLGLLWVALQMFGVRTAWRRSRLPDLCVTTMERAKELLEVSEILEDGALLVVEVVSPDSLKTDYRYKRTEYAAAGVPEYWIIDPISNKVSILQLVEGQYEETTYQGDEVLRSPLLPELSVTVNQILNI